MLERMIFCPLHKDEPLVLAAFSYRHDAHLVPGLIESIRPAVPARHASLIARALELGADWLQTPDLDERIEAGLADCLPDLLALGERTLWLFHRREMFEADHYRPDGLWGLKATLCLFPIAAAGPALDVALHSNWVADLPGYRIRDARINLYHLRMASPVRHQLRRDLHANADPGRRFQPLGYDDLTN